MTNQQIPSKEEFQKILKEGSNWGRWGDEDGAGAINLITPAKRLQAATLPRTGQTISMSRPLPKDPGPLNPLPAQHYVRWDKGGRIGVAKDFYGVSYHGWSTTHIDALCHIWDENGAWNGRDPESFLNPDGVTFADITNWKEGIITRGVLIDVPRHRNKPYVTLDEPVHGWEIDQIAREQDTAIEPGDALIVYSGRELYQADHPDDFMGGTNPSPGLHASCVKFIRDHDGALLGWDMMDAKPNEYDTLWTVPVSYTHLTLPTSDLV